jgi:hypothetical protein
MKDLGVHHHFLGVTVEPRPIGLLHQQQYTLDILERAGLTHWRAGLTHCKPCSTPVDTYGKLSEAEGPPVANPTAYQCLASALQYLTFTKPDITYAVQCMIPESPTSLLSSAASATSAALSTAACSFTGLPPPSSLSTLTRTGPGVRALGAPPPATLSF